MNTSILRQRFVYLALDAIGCRVDFSQDLLPAMRQLVTRCWETWGDFSPKTLRDLLLQTEGIDASFAAALLFFQQPNLVLENASTYFSYPNSWVRWPLTILLAQRQASHAFEAVCRLFPRDLTWNELHDEGDDSARSYWRRQCVSILYESNSAVITPYVQEALYATIPFTHYEIDEVPYNTLCRFQYDLIMLLQQHNVKESLQDAQIPQLDRDLWQMTWVAISLRNTFDMSRIQEIYHNPDIQSLLLQGFKQEFGGTSQSQQRALTAFIDYGWNFLIRV